MKVYSNSFPPWGDADGGWAQGVTYWKYSCAMSFQYVDALRTAAGIDLYQKPWFRENGWFKLYFHPPSCKLSHFGDTGAHGLDGRDANNLAHYAAVHRNPYFQWYAASVPGRLDSSPYGYFFFDSTLKPKPPVDVPQSRLSRDIGWVAMHSALWRPDDIMLFAKSSWYGSCSHSHADQNSFVLYGYGEPLAIDSGYYPWWNSPHHAQWAQQTKAHNSVLVDGEGQHIQDISVKGETLDFLGGSAYTYWLGEAAGAYRGKLKKFQRHILHLRPDVFVIYDDLEAAQPATFQWLLHSLKPMEIDAAAKSVLIQSGNARLWLKHLLPSELTQTQTDSFGIPPEPRGGEQPNQWHYTASTASKAPSGHFLTWLHVFEGSPALAEKVELLSSASAVALRANAQNRASRVAFAKTDIEASVQELAFDGKVAACEGDEGRPMRFLLVGGRRLRHGGTALVESSAPLSLSAGWLNGVFSCQATLPQDAKVTLFLGQKPAIVRLNGKPLAVSEWPYDAARKGVTLALKAGGHSIEAFAADPSMLRLAERVELRMLDKTPPMEWGSALGANYTQVLWSQFEAAPSFCRAKLDGPGEVWLNGEELAAGREALVQSRNQVLVEASLGAGIPKVTLEPLFSVGGAASAAAVADDDPRLAGALKTEAETYADGLRGAPQIYSHRTFLSGGKGVSTPPTMGVGARWKITVPKAGRYQLLFKVATHEASAVRAIMVDGQPVLGDNPVVRFPSTGGFGGTPAEWKHYAVNGTDGQPALLELAAGSHVIEMVSVEGLLNLDYLLLLPL